MKANELFVTKKTDENPDWGFARTPRIVLKRPDCELVQSCNSVRIGDFVTPNRDYHHEGLTAIVDGVNWKFLDTVAFRLETGKPIELKPKNVEVHPHKATYTYQAGDNELSVDYYLFKKTQNPLLCISFSYPQDAVLRALVFADIRPIHELKNGENTVSAEDNRITVTSQGKQLTAFSRSALTTLPFSFKQHWRYKLDSGGRREDAQGVHFHSDENTIDCIGEIELELRNGKAELFVSCGPAGKLNDYGLRKYDERIELIKTNRLLSTARSELEAAGKKWGGERAKALAVRLVNLMEKSWLENGIAAGSMWLRQYWLRDAFEGVLANFPAYYIHRKKEVKNLLAEALQLQKNGLIPTRLSPSPDYDSLDTTLLCLNASLEYLKRDNDKSLHALTEKAFKTFAAAAEKGGDVNLVNGLLSCRPNWSWTDSVRVVDGTRVSMRLPEEWVSKAFNEGKRNSLEEPVFFLAETNALWMKLLKNAPHNWLSTQLTETGKEFKKVFWNGETLAHAYSPEFGAAHEPSSHAVQAASLAPELFSGQELAALRNWVEPLFVKRGDKLFGMLTRKTGKTYFLGDGEYHKTTLWPRETPYLAKFLSLLADWNSVEQLLTSNLDYQVEEGAVNYCHELFSLPQGRNPTPTETAAFPVPVKNPAQYWSQWVQPYSDFLAKQR